MVIKLFVNDGAKRIIKSITKGITDKNKQFITTWIREKQNIKCFILYENNIPAVFALLSKCIYDPLNKHANPYILDLIYTFEPYRRKKLACELLVHIKKSNCITAFCSNDESIGLFKAAGYILTKYDECPLPTFRFP
ncbi:MAG: hypothetical protein ACYCPT_03910 [Acidimicrobiales bacterium]